MAKPRVTNNLPQFVGTVQQRGARTMTQVLIRGASELPPLVPVDTSVLLNSQYKDVQVEGDKVKGRVGFTAEYAAFVHAASGKLKGLPRPKRDGRERGTFWGPHDGQPGFLRIAFERAKPDIDNITAKGLKT